MYPLTTLFLLPCFQYIVVLKWPYLAYGPLRHGSAFQKFFGSPAVEWGEGQAQGGHHTDADTRKRGGRRAAR